MRLTKDISNTAPIIKVWLIIGLVMIFVQVIIGGVTRLTGSGLSITKWEIVTGTIPPLNAAQWEREFELYKQTPQYQKINKGMEMRDFKFIYFWEYFHRLWARTMGLIFALPFFYFLIKGMLSRELLRRLLVVVFLAMLVASIGWIMVASGLVNRPWVNAYKLSIHLSLGFLLFCYLLWTSFRVFLPRVEVIHKPLLKKAALFITILVSIQVLFGGMMSGMKAGLFYPTWPDMQGTFLPAIIGDSSAWTVENFVNYDTNALMPALIQFLHRNIAYLLIITILWFALKVYMIKKRPILQRTNMLLVTMLVIQVLLGIFTLINCKGSIPVGLGVMHQGGALLLLGTVLFVNYQFRQN